MTVEKGALLAMRIPVMPGHSKVRIAFWCRNRLKSRWGHATTVLDEHDLHNPVTAMWVMAGVNP